MPTPAPTVRAPRATPATPRRSSASRTCSFYYGTFRAVKDITIDVPTQPDHRAHRAVRLRQVHAPADDQPHERPDPRHARRGRDRCTTARTSTAPDVDPVEVRRRIGMVFQKPNPFPKSIYDNVAFGPRINGYKGDMDELVEQQPPARRASGTRSRTSSSSPGLSLSGGQQQRLCIARAIATEPEVILMDEPCSALDPRSTLQIEELMAELKQNYTIVIVTHNMQQAARASDYDGVPDHGRGPRRLRRRAGPTLRDLHQPQEPADRGLRVRSVRLSARTTDDRPADAGEPDRPTWTRSSRRPSECRRADQPALHPPRERARPRGGARSRTPSCAWAPWSRRRSARAIARAGRATTPTLALDGHQGRRARSTRPSARSRG